MVRISGAALLCAVLVCPAAVAQNVVAPAPAPAPTPAAAASTGPAAPAPRAAAPAGHVEAIPDPVKLPPAEVPYVHPLWRPLDQPPKLVEHPAPADFNARTTLFTTVRVDEKGKVSEGEAVNPPVAALAGPVKTLFPKWRFAPATRAGQTVTTWATYGIELAVSLEKATWVSFGLLPVAKDQPLEPIAKEAPGELWITQFPRDISPKDPSAISIEEVDVLPVPEKTNWSFSSARVRSHFTALVEVSSSGSVRRIVPTGTFEPLALAWLRQNAATWRITPGLAAGKPADSWMSLDATLEYTVDDAKEKGKRSVKKNLRGVVPVPAP